MGISSPEYPQGDHGSFILQAPPPPQPSLSLSLFHLKKWRHRRSSLQSCGVLLALKLPQRRGASQPLGINALKNEASIPDHPALLGGCSAFSDPWHAPHHWEGSHWPLSSSRKVSRSCCPMGMPADASPLRLLPMSSCWSRAGGFNHIPCPFHSSPCSSYPSRDP